MFTIRVYGLLVDHGAAPRVLVMDELIKGRHITKFPGGGLEYGEGPAECLVREIREELAMEAKDLRHFYTTDFFQQSVFHESPMQVISVYYFFTADHSQLTVLERPFAYTYEHQVEGARWLDIGQASVEALSLPIDQRVMRMLKDQFSSL